MTDKTINPNTATGRVYTIAFELLKENPEGVRWTDLNRLIKERDESLHPKTINGCIWKLIEKFPDEVYKPKKGLFRLKKFDSK